MVHPGIPGRGGRVAARARPGSDTTGSQTRTASEQIDPALLIATSDALDQLATQYIQELEKRRLSASKFAKSANIIPGYVKRLVSRSSRPFTAHEIEVLEQGLKVLQKMPTPSTDRADRTLAQIKQVIGRQAASIDEVTEVAKLNRNLIQTYLNGVPVSEYSVARMRAAVEQIEKWRAPDRRKQSAMRQEWKTRGITPRQMVQLTGLRESILENFRDGALVSSGYEEKIERAMKALSG